MIVRRMTVRRWPVWALRSDQNNHQAVPPNGALLHVTLPPGRSVVAPASSAQEAGNAALLGKIRPVRFRGPYAGTSPICRRAPYRVSPTAAGRRLLLSRDWTGRALQVRDLEGKGACRRDALPKGAVARTISTRFGHMARGSVMEKTRKSRPDARFGAFMCTPTRIRKKAPAPQRGVTIYWARRCLWALVPIWMRCPLVRLCQERFGSLQALVWQPNRENTVCRAFSYPL